MTMTLSRPPLPPCDPPTAALPPLPAGIRTPMRKRSGILGPPLTNRKVPASHQPSKLAIRTPSRSTIPSATVPTLLQANSTPCVPTLRSVASNLNKEGNGRERKVRRSISIAHFPQPPKGGTRLSALPGRPSLGGSSESSPVESFRRGSGDSSCLSTPVTPGGSVRGKKLKASPETTVKPFVASGAPSLLNGTGDDKCIPNESGPGQRGSDGLLSLPSPLHSRSSSVLGGSSETSATTFEDVEDTPRRGREDIVGAAVGGKKRSKTKERKGNVVVSVRVRPDAARSEEAKSDGEWMVDGRRSLVAFKGKEGGDYFYDNVFVTHDENRKVYDASAKRLVRRVMEGYHGTVFAYGMTGTGKTFSMQGTKDFPGITPLAIKDIFSYIRETPQREFLLRVSYLEIYNEKIHDLLSEPMTGGQQEEIKLREDSKRGVYASPLKEEIVQSPTQLLRVISRGDNSRRTGSTLYNSHSSRSHAVVQIVVESRERAEPNSSGEENKRAPIALGGVRVSTLSLIDLAGSERAAENKDRRAEGSHINKSLLTLGTIIARLSSDKEKSGNPTEKDIKHLPYRDSKLTRLLQPALSGNSLVSILCTIQIGYIGSTALANNHTAETLNTLKFASRAKNNLVSHARMADDTVYRNAEAGSQGLLDHYRNEVQSLRRQLRGKNNKSFASRQEKQRDEDDNRVRAMFTVEGKRPDKDDELDEDNRLDQGNDGIMALATDQGKRLAEEIEHRHEEHMLELQLARTALKERIDHLNRLILSSQSSGVNMKGSFSPLKYMNPNLPTNQCRTATRPQSSRSSTSHSGIYRTTSSGSTATATITTEHAKVTMSPPTSYDFPNVPETDPVNPEDETMGEFADGNATLQAQNRALQLDIADKNQYIFTLEKRLDQARRSSNTRSSLGFTPVVLLQEKDDEIADLMTQVEERDGTIAKLKERLGGLQETVAGLKQCVRKEIGTGGITRSRLGSTTIQAFASAMASKPTTNINTAVATLTAANHAAKSSHDSSTYSLSPVELLSSRPVKIDGGARRESMDELTKVLDDMIEERVRGRALGGNAGGSGGQE